VNLAVSWRDAKEMTFMRAVVRLVGRHAVAQGERILTADPCGG
jgi:hypothetical protein